MKRLIWVLGLMLLLVAGVVSAQGSPYITITTPAPGAQIANPEAGVPVTGTAGFLNDVVTVQALNASNQVVAQTTTNNPQPEGQWAVTLQVPYTGSGRIVALSGNNQTQSIDAYAEVYVTFGSAPTAVPPTSVPTAVTQPPTIVITNPQNGGTANVTTGTLTVTGTAANVFENNIIVQVRDSYSRTLVQTATTANASGAWTATLSLLIANGTTGSIRAWSQSPADGSVMAESLVNVTFSSACTPRTDWPVYIVQPGDTLYGIAVKVGSTTAELTAANCLPNPNVLFVGSPLYVPRLPSTPSAEPPQVTITTPGPNATVNAGAVLAVTGFSSGVPAGNTWVRAIDLTGAVLAEQLVTVTQTPASGPWTWQAALDASGIPAGARLTVYAYAVNPDDGRVLAAASNPITFGNGFTSQPFITITTPLPYTQLNDASRQVAISGRAGNLVDVITVQALNDNGDVMATTTVNNPQGADGEWAATLTVPETRRGRIVALSGNRTTQSVEAYAAVDVIFGDPTLASTYVLLNAPLPQTVITAEEPVVVIAGSLRGVFSDRVTLNLLDENQNILLSAPAQVNLTAGTWVLTTTANARIQAERRLSVQVIATTPDGGVLAADRVAIVTEP